MTDETHILSDNLTEVALKVKGFKLNIGRFEIQSPTGLSRDTKVLIDNEPVNYVNRIMIDIDASREDTKIILYAWPYKTEGE
jgi:hypothetical protein